VAVRKVLRYPNPLLKVVCASPDPSQLEQARRDLLDTMRSFGHCVGLAAPQLGQLVRVVVVDVSEHPQAPESCIGLMLLADPVVVESEGVEVAREGCLSVPHLTANVRRATRIVIEAAGGERIESEGFEARCLLHEIDHLDGILFLDRVDSLATDVFRRKRYR
jgi:peptide deformylase